ncbi:MULTISPECIES: xanthine dehydrogenase subunit XdhA [Lachnospiraceae]|uniref:Xanthine dehydrogenase molybdenum-binding subunit XdhA n=1 Tax=Faecalicatena acetigenes TaxID=2981790 RepID=A0ABT2TAD5_9FIRM|nr:MULTISPECIES: xanthine dehydrogenase subunit XdhA [Lachnospiraceae]MCU6747248.1 xanthine dehydrogenase molybdenum-binding subunit XdhA [Faecalicatena acetigenes]SCH75925.1 4-hydroxybenzoyl-CoA reductase subunit alpha [uncultured Clostridium sp.]
MENGEHVVGKSVKRVDAFEKVTGRAKYTDDLCGKEAYVAKILHSTVAHGIVKSIDTKEAEKIPGVVKIVTCFDVPKYYFPTAGHPWSTDPAHQDVADRLLLTEHVRFYGDDIAAVVAENEVAAAQAVRALKVEYETLPFVLDVQEAMREDAPQIHKTFPHNILKHTTIRNGNYEEASREPGLTKVEGWYQTPTVQHCHIENFICYAYMEQGRVVVVSSTQIPHICRRVVGQALGMPWGKVRVIKPYIGGGFGNKQDILYEPLCAYLSTVVGGRLVKLDVSREETFVCNRVRHAIRIHIISWVRKDGTFAARKIECFSDQGAYASHGHSIGAKCMNCFPQLYPCPHIEGDSYTVFTNKSVAGAMRGYGIPQAMFAMESHTEDVAKAMGIPSYQLRFQNVMPKGFQDGFSKNVNYYDTFRECMERGSKSFQYEEKAARYRNQIGDIRRGVGMAVFWYNTGVWPISLETSACRMILNQDGSVQVQVGETEIGQGADTAFAQMTAETLGVPFENVHVMTVQDTDITPFGLGAYASRQTYMAGFSIRQTAELLKDKILDAACEMTRQIKGNMNIVNGNIIRTTDGRMLMTMEELAMEKLYSLTNNGHLTAESSCQIKNNAYSFGCTFAEVEVDIPACRAEVVDILNVHDCGKLINPSLAEAQVHGGMSMGIGYGLTERLLYDEKTGRPLNNNLLDYKLSTFMDHPDLRAEFIENYEPTSAYGTKALGEPPTCSIAPAIRNAVLNATGVAVNEIPLTPHILFKRFKEEGLI